MKNLFVLTVALFFMTGCIGAGKISEVKPQGSDAFPIVEGIDLIGEIRELPASFEGKLNIVTVAFERDHQDDVNPWIDLAIEIMSDYPAIRFYEVPLIYEINAPYRMFINNGMRSGIPDKAARERTITVFTDRNAFITPMKMKTDTIYTLLLDEKGRILWRSADVLTDEKGAQLKAKIQGLMK